MDNEEDDKEIVRGHIAASNATSKDIVTYIEEDGEFVLVGAANGHRNRNFTVGTEFSLETENHYRALARTYIEARFPVRQRPLVFTNLSTADQFFRTLLKATRFALPDFTNADFLTAFRVVFNGLLPQLLASNVFKIDAGMNIMRPEQGRLGLGFAAPPAAITSGLEHAESTTVKQLREEIRQKDQTILQLQTSDAKLRVTVQQRDRTIQTLQGIDTLRRRTLQQNKQASQTSQVRSTTEGGPSTAAKSASQGAMPTLRDRSQQPSRQAQPTTPGPATATQQTPAYGTPITQGNTHEPNEETAENTRNKKRKLLPKTEPKD